MCVLATYAIDDDHAIAQLRRPSFVVLKQPTERLMADDILHTVLVYRFFCWQLASNRHVAEPLMGVRPARCTRRV